MKKAKEQIKGIDQRVIYQDRSYPTKGMKKCLISLLKPIIAADGKVYPCCGIQYAVKNEPLDFHHNMKGSLERIHDAQKHFNGELCDICYYSKYNELLNLLMEEYKNHKNNFMKC